MSTALPQKSSNKLSGEVSELKPTILKRGTVDIPLNIADSVGYHGFATIYLDDVTNNQEVGLLKCEVGIDPTLAGTVLYDLPLVEMDGSDNVQYAGRFYSAYVSGSGYTRQVLNIYYFDRSATGADSVRAYYKVKSEATLTQNWNYKSS